MNIFVTLSSLKSNVGKTLQREDNKKSFALSHSIALFFNSYSFIILIFSFFSLCRLTSSFASLCRGIVFTKLGDTMLICQPSAGATWRNSRHAQLYASSLSPLYSGLSPLPDVYLIAHHFFFLSHSMLLDGSTQALRPKEILCVGACSGVGSPAARGVEGGFIRTALHFSATSRCRDQLPPVAV